MDHLRCLSKREKEVLYWVTLGKTNWEIGMILNISLYTVKNHIKNILMKLDATNRTHAAQRATTLGIVLKASPESEPVQPQGVRETVASV